MEHFNEDQIDAMVFGLRFTGEALEHFFDCEDCFIAWRGSSDLVSALRQTGQFSRDGLPLELSARLSRELIGPKVSRDFW
jgi:site-specific recombinase